MSEENPFARLFTPLSVSAHFAVLEAGDNEAPITIRLIQADPKDTPYQCISYDRSRDLGSEDISVDGQPLTIPRPLAEALRALRASEHPRTFWADLLVGDSVQERSRQAAMMKSAVENADSVIAWLGQSNQHTNVAFDMLQQLSNRWQQACLHSGFPEKMSRATQKQTADLWNHLASKPVDDPQGSDKDLWDTVAALLSSSYFSSVQSIPEFVLAKQVIVRSGDSTLTWHDYVSASRSALFIMARMLQLSISEAQKKTFELINSLEIAQARRRNGETIELFPMIQQARECSTTDPREIVFSMLPIITPSGRAAAAARTEPPPVADYSKTVQDVLTDAARYIVHERQDLLFWWAESPPCRNRVLGLPSWVPDFTTGLPTLTVKVMPTEKNGLRCWWDHISPPPKRISIDDNKALHVQAHALDKIVSVSPILTASNCRRVCLQQWQALPDVPGEHRDAKLDKIWRALILNQAGMGETWRDPAVPPKEMWQSFFSVISEERILELLNCTQEQLQAQPELVARAKAHPEASLLGPYTGRSPPFEQLLHSNALGRRFFRTESGRVGMTAVEELPEGVDTQSQQQASSNPPAPDFTNIVQDPFMRSLMTQFQSYVQERDPRAAQALELGLAGELPGQRPQGARVGDMVVALVGGFQPYILRPNRELVPEGEESTQTTLESVSKYRFVGECYLHGVMNGEPFKSSSFWGWGSGQWKRDVNLVDISIM